MADPSSSVWDQEETVVVRDRRTLPRVRAPSSTTSRLRVNRSVPLPAGIPASPVAPAPLPPLPSVPPPLPNAEEVPLPIPKAREVPPGVLRKESISLMFFPLTLVTGLLSFLHVFALAALLMGVSAFTTMERTPLRLPLQRSMTDREAQLFLSVLLHLPGVRDVTYVTKEQAYETLRREAPEYLPFLERYVPENPLTDTAVVRLRSIPERRSFFAFLQRPESQAVLAPFFLWEIEAWKSAVLAEEMRQGAFAFVFLGGALLALGLLVMVLFQEMRARVRVRVGAGNESSLLALLSGADPATLRRPFLFQGFSLLLPSFLLAVAVVTASLFLLIRFLPERSLTIPLEALLRATPWILPLEAFLLAGVTWIIAFSSARPARFLPSLHGEDA